MKTKQNKPQERKPIQVPAEVLNKFKSVCALKGISMGDCFAELATKFIDSYYKTEGKK